jgi:hypothetical protein
LSGFGAACAEATTKAHKPMNVATITRIAASTGSKKGLRAVREDRPAKGIVRSSCVASLGNYSDRTRVPNPHGSTRSLQGVVPALAALLAAGNLAAGGAVGY